MKYSFDDIRPMKLNGGHKPSSVPPREIPPAVPKAERNQILQEKIKKEPVVQKKSPAQRVVIEEASVPWTKEPPHKTKSADQPTRPEAPHRPVSSKSLLVAFLWLFCIGLLVVGIVFAGNAFRRATITITPRILSGSITTELPAVQSGTFPDVIPFETMTITDSLESTILATESAVVNEKARGTVVLYNKTTSAQDLVSGTRLSAQNGKIYTLGHTVTVPAQKKVQGVATPGQIEVAIVAQEVGEAYNSGPTDFSIVAYKGTSKYATIYARSKGPITGGASGTGFRVSPEEFAKIKENLSLALTKKLQESAEKQVPEGYQFFKDATAITVTVSSPEAISPRASIVVTAQGKLTAALIPKEAFAYSIARALAPDVTPITKLEEPDIQSLSISLSEENKASLGSDTTIAFTITGAASVRYNVHVEKIKQAVLGIEKTSLIDTVAKEPGVARAEFSTFPWYSKRLPENPDRIRVIVR
jgi:hypothetical protein